MSEASEALQANRGGISPEIAAALVELDLVSEERVLPHVERYAREWHRHFEDNEWWAELAKIALQNEVPWYKRWFGLASPSLWAYDWIVEKRGS
jgi:hypothetical protein